MNNSIYIYKAMNRFAGYEILKTASSRMNEEDPKQDGKVLWLLRESNTQQGMLSIDFIRWNRATSEWIQKSLRLALTAQGWVNAVNPSSIVLLTKLNAEVVGQYESSLNTFILNYSTIKFCVSNRVNPRREEQTKCDIYSGYVTKRIGMLQKGLCSVELTPGAKQAITCELSGKAFKNPVVYYKEQCVQLKTGEYVLLHKGRSYEKLELKSLNIPDTDYYPNIQLQKVINRLGNDNPEKIQSLAPDLLQDPISSRPLINPVFIPSGHSFSEFTLLNICRLHCYARCPVTSMPFDLSDIVNNVNLDRFIKEWTLRDSNSKTLLFSQNAVQSNHSKDDSDITVVAPAVSTTRYRTL